MQPTRPLDDILRQSTTVGDLGIPGSLIHDLVFRILFNEGDVSVGRFVDVIKVHAQIIDETLGWMQNERLVEIAKAGQLGRLSYVYRLTEEGMRRARDSMDRSQYVGAAPVNLNDYNDAIIHQTGAKHNIGPKDVARALDRLVLADGFHRRIGPAIRAGTSLFLYGPPGNGKTTVAQAIASVLAGTEPIWLPYAVTIAGQIIQIYDPLVHIPDDARTDYLRSVGKVDRRWTMFKRPAVMVGGELQMAALDLRHDPTAKFYEAPLQMKANGGMFLIDDFGRQQISPQQLLNRWIVPLEDRVDYLRLHTGQTIQVPFHQLIVFSTNLDPAALVDGAFLRRIQIKVEVGSPDERMFYEIFKAACGQFGITFDQASFLHLLKTWYREPKRDLQAVHPRDLIKGVIAICDYEGIQPRLTPDLLDEACRGYFVDI